MKALNLLAQLGMAILCGNLMVGCNSTPSPGDAETVLRQKIESQSGGQIKLVSFKKTDGQKFEVNSVQGYKMDYEAEIEFQADGMWLTVDVFNLGSGLTFGFRAGQASENVSDQLKDSAVGGSGVHRGGRAKIAGVMEGEKKESGWKFSVGESRFTLISKENPASSSTSSKTAQDQAPNNVPVAANVKRETLNEDSLGFSPCPVPTESGLWGYINQAGRFTIAPKYAAAEFFFDGYAFGYTGKNSPPIHIVDIKGTEIFSVFEKDGGGFNIMDANGQPIPAAKLPKVINDELSCRANLLKISSALFKWQLEHPLFEMKNGTYVARTNKPNLGNLVDGQTTNCPAGGTYTLSNADILCSIPGHSIYDSGRAFQDGYSKRYHALVSKCGFKVVSTNGISSWYNAQGSSVYEFKLKRTTPPPSCVDILRQIDGAKNQWALEMRKKNGDVPAPSDLTPYIKLTVDNTIPSCPQGGTYTLNPVGEYPACSVPGHALP